MAVAIFLPMAIFSWVGLDNLLERERRTRLQAMQETARATALALDQEIAKAEGALLVLAQSLHIPSEEFAELYSLMEKGAKAEDNWTVLFDQDGYLLVNTFASLGTAFPRLPYKWVSAAISARKTTVTNVRTGLLSKEPVVSVNVPVFSPTGQKYLLSQVFRVTRFNKLLRSSAISPTWIVSVFGSDGMAIARNVRADQFVMQPVPTALYQAALQTAHGQTRYVTRENIAVYGAFTHTDRTGWTVSVGVPIKEIDGAARRAAWYTASIAGAILLLALSVIFFLARRLTYSIDEVVASAKVLGRGGIPQMREAKVKELTVLQKALHDAGKALSEENTSRLALLDEREKLLKSEKEARQLAENQNKAKDEFLAMLGHELRNPLAPISTAAQLLKIAGSNETIVKQYSEVIERQASHMAELINDLMDVSRVTRGLVTLKKEPVDMKLAVENAIEQVRPLIKARHHSLAVNIAPAEAYVLGDQTRLVQVITNLLNNAAKYTPHGGQLSVALKAEAEQVRVSVTDNGNGIEPSLLPHIFDAFTQAIRTPDRSQGGLGLGLTLVKSLVTLHDGQVHACSEGLGQGSTFTLVLPVLNKMASQIKRREPEKAKGAGKPLKMMIVDDNQDAARSLAVLLSTHGHQVLVEHDPQDALASAQAHSAEVFILDIGLPGMDGYELARRLRADPKTAQAVFIALTGYGQENDREKAFAAGFDHHLVKPVDTQKLAAILGESGT